MEVYLIRHTTPDVLPGLCYGQSDLDILSTTFNEEVDAIKGKLDKAVDRWFTSPLKRCYLLATEFQENPTLDDRLKELNFGYWEMKSWNQINKKDLDFWMDDFVNRPAVGGESYIDLYRRCQQFLEDLLQTSHEKVAIVTHAGNIRAIMSYVLDLPLEHSFRIQINYGSIVKLKLDNNKAMCQLISMQ